MNTFTEGWKDKLITHVRITFGWKDRLRILFGRTAHVHVSTPLRDVMPEDGHGKTTTETYTEPLFPNLRKRTGYMHEAS